MKDGSKCWGSATKPGGGAELSLARTKVLLPRHVKPFDAVANTPLGCTARSCAAIGADKNFYRTPEKT